MHTITLNAKTTFSYLGPSLQEGPLPAFFYFCLSAKETLEMEPFTLPLVPFKNEAIRIFSLTLPLHGEELNPRTLISAWEEALLKGENIIDPFFLQVEEVLAFLKPYLLPKKVGVGGISRGGFIATHLAARHEIFTSILAFAPMTRLPTLDLKAIAPKIISKPVRFYIGNHDLSRARTDECFAFIKELADLSFDQGIKSPPVELFIKPSIGYQGHGTSTETFLEGGRWMVERLLS